MRRIIVVLLLLFVVVGIFMTSQGGKVPFKLPAVSDLKAPDLGSLLPSGPSGEKQPPAAVPPQQVVQQKYRVAKTVNKWSDSDPVKAKVFGQTSPGALVTKTNESKNGKTLVLDEKSMPYWIETSALVPVTQSGQSAPPAQKSTAPASADPGFTMPKIDPAAAVRSMFKAGTQIIESKGKSGPTTGPGGAVTAAWEFGNLPIWGGFTLITIAVIVFLYRKITKKIAIHKSQGTLIPTVITAFVLAAILVAIIIATKIPNLVTALQSAKGSPTAAFTISTNWAMTLAPVIGVVIALLIVYAVIKGDLVKKAVSNFTNAVTSLIVAFFLLGLFLAAVAVVLAISLPGTAGNVAGAMKNMPLVSYAGIIPGMMKEIAIMNKEFLLLLGCLIAGALFFGNLGNGNPNQGH